eukprot:Awhi_evm2s14410
MPITHTCKGGPSILPKLVGKGPASRILLTGQAFGANDGQKIGLFTQITDDGASCLDWAIKDAELVAKNGPIAVSHCKKAIHLGM